MTTGKRYQFDSETEVHLHDAELTEQEYDWLSTITERRKASGSDPAHIDSISIQTEKLAQIAFEYDLLQQVASTVEIEVLRYFRGSEESTLTTGEVSDALDRSKSSVSRALNRLAEKDQLEQVQQGVYRE